MAIFAGFAFVLGAAGTTAIGATFGSFVLTWPVCLYATFRGVMSLGLNRAASGWQHEVSARLMLVAFAGLCYGYYSLCMAVGYAMGWGFLGGFGVSWPLAWVAERSKSRTRRWLGEATGFAVWFWVSGLIPGWKAALAAGGE